MGGALHPAPRAGGAGGRGAPQGGADWCLVEIQDTKGWVNARFLTPIEDWDI